MNQYTIKTRHNTFVWGYTDQISNLASRTRASTQGERHTKYRIGWKLPDSVSQLTKKINIRTNELASTWFRRSFFTITTHKLTIKKLPCEQTTQIKKRNAQINKAIRWKVPD